jgi:phosphomannomutase
MGIIYTYYVLKHKRFTKTPYIISSYVSTNLIDRIAKAYKAKVYRTGTGFK